MNTLKTLVTAGALALGTLAYSNLVQAQPADNSGNPFAAMEKITEEYNQANEGLKKKDKETDELDRQIDEAIARAEEISRKLTEKTPEPTEKHPLVKAAEAMRSLDDELDAAQQRLLCSPASSMFYPVVDKKGQKLNIGTTYQNPDGSITLVGMAKPKGYQEAFDTHCPRIASRAESALKLESLTERLELERENLVDSLTTRVPFLISYASTNLMQTINDNIDQLAAAHYTQGGFLPTAQDKGLAQSGYFRKLEEEVITAESGSPINALQFYLGLSKAGTANDSNVLRDVAVKGMLGSLERITTPAFQFDEGHYSQTTAPALSPAHSSVLKGVGEDVVEYLQVLSTISS